MSKAIAEKQEAGLPSADVMDLITEHEGVGLDYETSELQIPFIRLAQPGSPQVKKSKPEFIEGLQVGDIFNTVTGQAFDGEEGIEVIPCFQETKYLKFTPRAQGGGFLGELAKDDPDINRTTRVGATETLPDGNELVKSDQHYCLIMNPSGAPTFGIVDMKSSSLKISRRWKTQLAMLSTTDANGVARKPAIFATKWKLTTVEETNNDGSWTQWSVAHAGFVPDKETFLMAKQFRESIQSGAAQAVNENPSPSGDGKKKTVDAPF